jgi:hypothetical protein
MGTTCSSLVAYKQRCLISLCCLRVSPYRLLHLWTSRGMMRLRHDPQFLLRSVFLFFYGYQNKSGSWSVAFGTRDSNPCRYTRRACHTVATCLIAFMSCHVCIPHRMRYTCTVWPQPLSSFQPRDNVPRRHTIGWVPWMTQPDLQISCCHNSVLRTLRTYIHVNVPEIVQVREYLNHYTSR